MVETLECRQLLTTLPTGFTETRIGNFGFHSPTSMSLAPDGRVFVAEQNGELKVVKNGQVLPTPFVTVPTVTDGERGLMAVELDPNFATNGYVYVTYTSTEGFLHNRLSRFTAASDVAAPGSETIIYESGPMNVTIHQSGAIRFGPDGKLYTTVGENGGGSLAQSIESYKGKILRLNPDGSIPTDNPFYNETTGDLRAIYAMGFRNPFSFAIQPTTGLIYLNDVGTGVWEEVNEIVPRGNYGYPDVEGATNDPRFITPIHTYSHGEGCAIVGASFYNPTTATFPADYHGDYFFGDLCAREIRRLDPTTKEVEVFAEATQGRVVDLEVAADGSLYYLMRDLAPNYDGGLFRVAFVGTGTGAPIITSQPEGAMVRIGQPATFTVAASGSAPLSYQWQRDGVNILGATQASYTTAATTADDSGAQFRVVVSNGQGSAMSNAATLIASNNEPPVVTITSPAPGASFVAGDTINFAGTATDPEDGVRLATAFTWRIDLMHADTPENEHAHPLMPPTTGTRTGSFTPSLAGHYETAIWLRVFLTVRDSDGFETTTFTDVQPVKSTMTFEASHPGLRVTLDGTPVRTPAPVLAVAGVPRTLGAPATQTVNGVRYEFVSWSDDGDAEHGITAPSDHTTYTATYRALDDGSQNPESSPDLSVAFVQQPATSVVAGTRTRTRLSLTNHGPTPFAAAATTGLYLSTDPYLDPEDVEVATLPRTLRIRPGGTRVLKVPVTMPEGTVAGAYHLLAHADAARAVAERDETNNVVASTAPVTVEPVRRDFTATLSSVTVRPTRARAGIATVLVRYEGNLPARGTLGIELRGSSDAAAEAADPLVATLARRVRMKAGTTKMLRVRFDSGNLAPGVYYLTATADSANAFAETNETNNTAVSTTTLTVGG